LPFQHHQGPIKRSVEGLEIVHPVFIHKRVWIGGETIILAGAKSGTFVARIPVSSIPEAIIARTSLESVTVRAATKHRTLSGILVLCSLVEVQREATEKNSDKAFHKADEDFHAMPV